MWKIVYASVPGTSHIQNGTCCQDASWAEAIPVADGEVLIAVCSDGAGSAQHAEVGSAFVCEQLGRNLASELGCGTLTHLTATEDVIRQHLRRLREALDDYAASLSVEIRDLACTLLVAIVWKERAVFAQIGDGAIVFDDACGLDVAFWPQGGEYAGVTNFITQSDYLDCLQVLGIPRQIAACVLFTDGIERLALRFATNEVHAPFFEPMLATLKQSSDPCALVEPLRTFLASEAINLRTDDDKTLILAIRPD